MAIPYLRVEDKKPTQPHLKPLAKCRTQCLVLSQYFIGIVAFVVLEVIHLMGLPVWALLVVRFTAVDLG